MISKFVCDNHVIITYYLKKKDINHVFKIIILWKLTVTVNLNKFYSSNIFRRYTFGEFYTARFNYFRGRPNKVNERFWNIFHLPYAGDIGNENIAGKYKKIIVSVSPTLY